MELHDKLLADVTLEKARYLLECLERGKMNDAKEVIDGLSQIREASLFSEIGKLTRQLHEALNSFQLDSKLPGLAAQELPDATARLNFVIETTENAANKTMDSVEKCIPMSQHIRQVSDELLADWQKLYRRELGPGEFRKLASKIENFLKSINQDSEQLNGLLTDVLVAQDYQDLTGQVIRRVISLVKEVEDNLVDMIKAFGGLDSFKNAQKKEIKITGTEGPVIDKTREDVVTSQDDVDDLLSSLGF